MLLGLVLCAGSIARAAEPLTLEAALKEASQSGPLVLEANARAEAADSAVLAAGQLPHTTLAVGGGTDDPIWLVQARQPLYAFGVRSARISAAQHSAAAAHALAEQAMGDSRAEVRRAFVALVAAQQRKALGERMLRLYQSATRIARERLEAGTGQEVDVAQATLREAISDADLHTLSAAAAARSAELAVALGRDPVKPVVVDETSRAGRRPTIEDVFKALTHSPWARAQAESVAAAHASVDEQRAARFPAFSLALGTEAGNGGQGAAIRGGIEFDLPLLSLNRGQISQASATLATAELLRSLEQRARVGKAVATHRKLLGAMDALADYEAKVLPAADAAEDLALAAYREGKSTLTALLEAQRSSAEMRGKAIDARQDADTAAAELSAILGVEIDVQ